MKDLIAALLILQDCLKDPDNKWPTACEHDVLYVCGVNLNLITADMLHQLNKLGFLPGSDEDIDLMTQYDEDGDYCGEIDFSTIDQETWDDIKDDLTDCFRSYRFGSC